MSKRFFYEYVTSGLELRELPYESHPIDALYRYHDGNRLSSWSPNRKPKKILDWLKKKAIKHGVDESVALLLESAEQLAKKETITDQKQYDELVSEVTRIIQAKIDKLVPRDMEHGKKFKAGRQAPGMMTSILDDELRKVLNMIGVRASFEDILKYIEELAKGGHPCWQEVVRDDPYRKPEYRNKIYFKAPDTRTFEDERKFKTVKNRIAKIKKTIVDKP